MPTKAMMEVLQQTLLECFPCLAGRKSTDYFKAKENTRYGFVDEKAMIYSDEKMQLDAEDFAQKLFSIFQNPDEPGRDLRNFAQDFAYQTSSWKEHFARVLKATIEKAIMEGTLIKKGPMGEAYEKAVRAADGIAGFAHDHPVWTAVIAIVIALGIMYLLMPVVLEILGFGIEGPIEGSLVASWESMYGGYVPAGSLFSYLQRLGMTRKWFPSVKAVVPLEHSLL